MTDTSSTRPLDRRTRDARIRELDAQGWSNARIGAEVGLTREGVRKILLGSTTPESKLAEHETKLQAELEELVRHEEANRRRIRAVRRALERIDEEREAAAIDRLLGLA